jgi:hypothetical protein
VRRRIDIAWAPEASAAPVTVGEVTVTPQARALVVHLPQGGLVWNRPTAVTIEQAGAKTRVPVMDVTRILQLALFTLAAGIAAARRPHAERR